MNERPDLMLLPAHMIRGMTPKEFALALRKDLRNKKQARGKAKRRGQ